MSINIDHKPNRAIFRAGDKIAGEYILDDPFKPYMHPLRSPAGHAVTVAMPGDHRHHKGLMYALRCQDLNFWEEKPGSGHCGVEEILWTEVVDEGTLAQELRWREQNGHLETYREERRIGCRLSEGGKAFEWTWRSRREALRNHRLVKSQWSLEVPDGRKINYHGLGIRLPWMWSFGGDDCTYNGVESAGKPLTAVEACGSCRPEMTFHGCVDGHWNAPRAAITIRQDHGYGWFVLKGDFAYLAAGPSNLEELQVAQGQVFEETFSIVVEDR